MIRKVCALAAAVALSPLLTSAPALADDHLVNAFLHATPNLGNSNPGCVPGAGSPNLGNDTGTPSNSGGLVSCRQNGTVGTGAP